MKNSGLRKLEAVSFTKVKVQDGFWAPRQDTNRRVTLPMEYKQCKETGRIDAWTWKKGEPNEPHIFWDSDVGKWIEAASYSLATHPDKSLEEKIDAAVDLMEKGQCADGYLNSHFSLVEPEKRWTHVKDLHEPYCAGHLMEGAVAYYQATGKRKFLDIMCRYADHIATVFGPGQGQKAGYGGHPEIELALVKLYRATGNKRYLDLSKFFVDARGQSPHYYDIEAKARGEDPKPGWEHSWQYSWYQAHKPLRDQAKVVGHAVMAMYDFSGMADVAAETGDPSLVRALKRLWENLTTKRMHVTGGIGSTRRNEGFTFDYDLPNETAYNETCANISLVFLAHRMFHLDPDGGYMDVMERALYNSVLSGVALNGDHFFYANPLESHPGVDPGIDRMGPIHDVDYHYRRSLWFDCACCPPNIARLLSSFGGYIYSQGKGEAWVNLYVAGRGELTVNGQGVVLEQKTKYPWDGKVTVTVRPEAPAAFAVKLRIPGWCRDARLKVNGKLVPVKTIKGYASIDRRWLAGDRIELMLPMPVERVEAHPHVRHDGACVALQRGPVVYCLEEVDNGRDLSDLILPRKARLTAKFESSLLGGVGVITGKMTRRDSSKWDGALYQVGKTPRRPVAFKAIPYAVWANRKPGEMKVWIRDDGL
ncbi:MAG: beta-L-arabinofuranosidase domain-containing protein [bacterium]